MSDLLAVVSRWALRALFTVGGVAIVYHEVWVADSSEPLLVFAGLWLAGVPIADLLDKLRKLAQPVAPPSIPPPTEADPRVPHGDRRRRRK